MSLVVRAQLRFLWRVRGSLVSALIGIALGVASIVGVHLLSERIHQRVVEQAQPLGNVDLYLHKPDLSERDYFELRRLWRSGGLPRVAALFPLVEAQSELDGEPVLLVGTDPLSLGGGLPQPSRRASTSNERTDFVAPVASLDQLFTRNSVILPASSDTPEAHAAAPSVRLGGVSLEVLGFSAPEGVVIGDLPTVRAVAAAVRGSQRTFDQGLTRIGVRLRHPEETLGGFDGFWRAGLQTLRHLFPGALAEPPVDVLTELDKQWRQTQAASGDPTQQLLQSVLFNVAALSVLSLVVAWLLTYQVACHALSRRAQMFERLQKLGVAQTRLRRLTLTEGVAVGGVATLFGAWVGELLANLLLASALGEQAGEPLVLSFFPWLKAVFSGLGVALLSYWLATRQLFSLGLNPASGRLVLPDEDRTGSGAALRQALLALGLGGLFVWGVLGDTLVGAFLCIVVCALALILYLPVLVTWLWRRSLTPQSDGRAVLPLLAWRQVLIGQELRLGISALALALATAMGIGIMVDSFRGAFLTMLDQRLADDVVLQLSAGEQGIDVDELSRRAGPFSTDSFSRGEITLSVDGVSGSLEFADRYAQLLRRFVPSTVSADVDTNSVLVNESFARRYQLQQGSVVELAGASESVQATIGGVFTDFGGFRPRLLGRAELAQQLDPAARFDALYLRVPSRTALRDEVQQLIDSKRIEFRDQRVVRERSIEIFEQTFAITRALTWLALLVAVVALANAIAAHTLQQTPVTRQLQVLGLATAAQKRLRLRRTLYVGGASLGLSIPLGLAIAALLCWLVNPRAFGWSFALQLTPAGVGWPMVAGGVGVLLAAWLGDAFQRFRRAPAAWGSANVVLLGMLAVGLLGGCSDKSADSAPSVSVADVLGGQSRTGAASADSGALNLAGFARATAVKPFVFPADHGVHPDYRSEWWYLTCPLTAADGNEFGVQFTLFRQAIAPPASLPEKRSAWRSGQVYMAHAALTDVLDAEHVESSRFARGHPDLAGVTAEPFSAWLENWRLGRRDASREARFVGDPGPLTLSVDADQFRIDLQLDAVKALVRQGNQGLSYKGSSEASYYYSFPRLEARGRVAIGVSDQGPLTAASTQWETVSGACWLDREWSTSVLADHLAGWDWFALQFDDGSELMLFQLRERVQATTTPNSEPAGGPSTGEDDLHDPKQAMQVSAAGKMDRLSGDALNFQVQRHWRDETGVQWPVEWTVALPERELRVVAAVDDQRMRSSIAYWEGLVWVYENERRVGQGYLEMTGYAQ